jgi:hypothetical protein
MAKRFDPQTLTQYRDASANAVSKGGTREIELRFGIDVARFYIKNNTLLVHDVQHAPFQQDCRRVE